MKLGRHQLNLIPHPYSQAPIGLSAEVSVAISRTGLYLEYRLSFEPGTIAWPDPVSSARADGLWQTTCFELFVGRPDSPAYDEFNFSPSGEWAAYAFDNYRTGMHVLPLAKPPALSVSIANGLHLAATLALPEAFDMAKIHPAALTAVIEASDGTKSYWSLVHPPGAPDFHHRDCFALRLGAAAGT